MTATSTPLNLSTLPSFTSQGLKRPTYNPSNLTPGILHIGVGNFARAHQAHYLHLLHESQTPSDDWGILGSSVLPPDSVYTAMKSQQFLYTLVEKSATRTTSSVIASYVGFLPPENSHALISALSDPRIKIVSLTITEGGYFHSGSTFLSSHPHITSDASNLRQVKHPTTAFGYIISAILERRSKNIPPFTVMSCDNVPQNGRIARAATIGLANLFDPQLAVWIRENISFPNSMVDRITPKTDPTYVEYLSDTYGILDKCPVFCEMFSQWVVEDDFPTGRPALEEVGVQFVKDVTPYETLKLRIVNGGHAVIGYAAALLDIPFAHEAMSHDIIRKFLRAVTAEFLETVPHIAGVCPRTYARTIEERFANPALRDDVERLCEDGSNRQPKFVIPAIKERLSAGEDVEGLALLCALWCRYCFGVSESGRPVKGDDVCWQVLNEKARLSRKTPLVWIRMQVYNGVSSSQRFEEAFCGWLLQIWKVGVLKCLQCFVADHVEE